MPKLEQTKTMVIYVWIDEKVVTDKANIFWCPPSVHLISKVGD